MASVAMEAFLCLGQTNIILQNDLHQLQQSYPDGIPANVLLQTAAQWDIPLTFEDLHAYRASFPQRALNDKQLATAVDDGCIHLSFGNHDITFRF